MHKFFVSLILLVAIFSFMSCGSDDAEVFLTVDEYVTVKNLTPQETATGLRYIIRDEGEDPKPTLAANVNINYEGFFLEEVVQRNFDQGDDVTFGLNQLILGWQEGLQLIGTGGKITLLIPSNLAYGERGAASIPGSTDIGFDIDLLGFDYASIEEFLAENPLENLSVTTSGLQYRISEMGEGPSPMDNATVVLSYRLFFLGGNGFETAIDTEFNLDDLIPGWKEGLQLIGTGGRILLLVPSELAYQELGTDVIPPNTDIGIDVRIQEIR